LPGKQQFAQLGEKLWVLTDILLALAGVAGALSGMAFQRAVAAGAATREGKIMSLAGLAGLGAFGCASG
jgi:hypothetical protein